MNDMEISPWFNL